MTDRELLELAAKAAGLDGAKYQEPETWFEVRYGLQEAMWHESTGYWNPLEDDGDALRLAVQLRLVVYCDKEEAWCEWGALNDDNEYPFRTSAEPEHNGPGSVRRAIVRAAAEIGKAMP